MMKGLEGKRHEKSLETLEYIQFGEEKSARKYGNTLQVPEGITRIVQSQSRARKDGFKS